MARDTTPSGIIKSEQANKNPEQPEQDRTNVIDLLYEVQKNFEYTQLWLQQLPQEELSDTETQQLIQELERELMSLEQEILNPNSLPTDKQQKLHDRINEFYDLINQVNDSIREENLDAVQPLQKYLEKRRKEFEQQHNLEQIESRIEQAKKLHPEIDTTILSEREIMGSTRFALEELNDQFNKQLSPEEYAELGNLFGNLNEALSYIIQREDHPTQQRKILQEMDLIDLERIVRTQNPELWEKFIQVLQRPDGDEIIKFLLGNTDEITQREDDQLPFHISQSKADQMDLSKRSEEKEQLTSQIEPNLIHIAIANSVEKLHESDKAEERKEHRDAIINFYGEIPEALDAHSFEYLSEKRREQALNRMRGVITDESRQQKMADSIDIMLNYKDRFDDTTMTEHMKAKLLAGENHHTEERFNGRAYWSGYIKLLDKYLNTAKEATENDIDVQELKQQATGYIENTLQFVAKLLDMSRRRERQQEGVIGNLMQGEISQAGKTVAENIVPHRFKQLIAMIRTLSTDPHPKLTSEKEGENTQERLEQEHLRGVHELLSYLNENQDRIQDLLPKSYQFTELDNYNSFTEAVQEMNLEFMKRNSHNPVLDEELERELRDYRGWDFEYLRQIEAEERFDILDLVATGDPELDQKLKSTDFYTGEIDFKGATLDESTKNMPETFQQAVEEEGEVSKPELVYKELEAHLDRWRKECREVGFEDFYNKYFDGKFTERGGFDENGASLTDFKVDEDRNIIICRENKNIELLCFADYYEEKLEMLNNSGVVELDSLVIKNSESSNRHLPETLLYVSEFVGEKNKVFPDSSIHCHDDFSSDDIILDSPRPRTNDSQPESKDQIIRNFANSLLKYTDKVEVHNPHPAPDHADDQSFSEWCREWGEKSFTLTSEDLD